MNPRRVQRDSVLGVTPKPHADAQRKSGRPTATGAQRRRRERAPPASTPHEKRQWVPVGSDRLTFVPDVLLPSQFYGARAHTSGPASRELWLLRAVLENAVHTWLHYKDAQDRRGQRFFEETETWFMSTRRDYLCAFESICEHLQLDPDYIRQGLRTWQHPATTQTGARLRR